MRFRAEQFAVAVLLSIAGMGVGAGIVLVSIFARDLRWQEVGR